MADALEPIRRVFRNAGLYHHASDDLLCQELLAARINAGPHYFDGVNPPTPVAAPPAALAVPIDFGDLFSPFYNALDELFGRGWGEALKERRRYDPRGTKEYQDVIDVVRAALAQQPAAAVPSLASVLDAYEQQTKALPCQHEIPERGCSTYNWQMAAIRDLRAMLKQAPPAAAVPAEAQTVVCQSNCDCKPGDLCRYWKGAAPAQHPAALAVPAYYPLGETIYTPPSEEVRFCYSRGQPNNINASRLGEACRRAAEKPGGDYIDGGLSLLKELEARGYGVFRFAKSAHEQPQQPAAAVPEGAIEAAYWDFDARHKGYGPHKTTPQSERDAFKWAVRSLLAAAQQPAAAVPADVARHAAVAVTYLDCSGGMPAGLSLALQRLRAALAQQPAAAVPVQNREPTRTGLASQCCDSAQLSTLPQWCRDLLAKAADALSEAQQPAAAAGPEGYRLVRSALDDNIRKALDDISYFEGDEEMLGAWESLLAAAERKGEES